MKRLPDSSRIRTLLCQSRQSAPVSLSLTLDRSNRIAADTWHRVYLSRFHTDSTASRFGVGQTSNPALIRPMYISAPNYHWPGGRAFVKQYCRTCDTCWKGGTWSELNRTKVYSISKKLNSAKVWVTLYI